MPEANKVNFLLLKHKLELFTKKKKRLEVSYHYIFNLIFFQTLIP